MLDGLRRAREWLAGAEEYEEEHGPESKLGMSHPWVVTHLPALRRYQARYQNHVQ
jgi:hypothetical protein